MHASPAEPTSPSRSRVLRAQSTRARLELGVPGRTILAQSARAIAQARDLEGRVRQLQARFRSPESRAVEVVEATLETLGASVGIVARRTRDGAAVELVGAVQLPDELSAELRQLPLDAPLPLTEVIRTGEPVYCATRDELLTRYPAMRELAERLGLHALCAAPIRYLGVLRLGVAFGYTSPRTFSAAERATLRALGKRYARALRDSRVDVAERAARSAETATRRATEDASAAAEASALARSDLVAAVSHDMRTPLQAILGYAELLAEGTTEKFTETQREFARRIVLSSLSLAQVVENLIQLSAVQLGRMQLDIAPFDLKRLIRDVVRLADPLAHHKGIALRADLVPAEMTSDRLRVRQIVTNLVENAITRTKIGEVAVSLTTAAGPGYETVRIVVRDSGYGLDEADLPLVLEPYWQGKQSAPVSKHDAGLGLSAVRHLTRLLGGEVRAEAAPGGGSSFIVELPRVAPGGESRGG